MDGLTSVRASLRRNEIDEHVLERGGDRPDRRHLDAPLLEAGPNRRRCVRRRCRKRARGRARRTPEHLRRRAARRAPRVADAKYPSRPPPAARRTAAGASSGASTASRRPSCSSATRAQRSASSRYGVAITIVRPLERNSESSFQNSRRETGSTPVVGSSSSRTFGSWTSVQASASFCFIPPEAGRPGGHGTASAASSPAADRGPAGSGPCHESRRRTRCSRRSSDRRRD